MNRIKRLLCIIMSALLIFIFNISLMSAQAFNNSLHINNLNQDDHLEAILLNEETKTFVMEINNDLFTGDNFDGVGLSDDVVIELFNEAFHNQLYNEGHITLDLTPYLTFDDFTDEIYMDIFYTNESFMSAFDTEVKSSVMKIKNDLYSKEFSQNESYFRDKDFGISLTDDIVIEIINEVFESQFRKYTEAYNTLDLTPYLTFS